MLEDDSAVFTSEVDLALAPASYSEKQRHHCIFPPPS